MSLARASRLVAVLTTLAAFAIADRAFAAETTAGRRQTSVAPLFIHGAGRGLDEMHFDPRAILLSERDGLEILWDQLGPAGLGFERRARGAGVDSPRGRPLVFDLFSERLRLGVTFVGIHNYEDLASPLAEHELWDTLAVAQQTAERLQGSTAAAAGVFYDPIFERDLDPLLGARGVLVRPGTGSRELLRSQIHDFIRWARAHAAPRLRRKAVARLGTGPPRLDASGEMSPPERERNAEFAGIERTALGGEASGCASLPPLLGSNDYERLEVVARALGWCGAEDSVELLLAALRTMGWSDAVAAALFRIDPDWRTRASGRRLFEEVRTRWWGNVSTHRNGDMGDSLAVWKDCELMLRLDLERAAPIIAAAFSHPPVGQAEVCGGSWPESLLPRRSSRSLVSALLSSVARAPAWPCLAEMEPLLDVVRVGWRSSDEARAAADVYASRLGDPSPEGRSRARFCLSTLRDPRALAGDDKTTVVAILEDATDRAGPGGVSDAFDADSLEALARAGGSPIVEKLRACTEDTESEWWFDCALALARLGRRELTPVYRRWLERPAPPLPRSVSVAPAEPCPVDVWAARQAYFRWGELRRVGVAGLGRTLERDALPLLRAIVADSNETDLVLYEIARLAAEQTGSDWTDLLLEIAAQVGRRGEDACGIHPFARHPWHTARRALVGRGAKQALPVLWARLSGNGHCREHGDCAETLADAMQLDARSTLAHLRRGADRDPAARMLLAEALLDPLARSTSKELLAVLDDVSRPESDLHRLDGQVPERGGRRPLTPRILLTLARRPALEPEGLRLVERFREDRSPRVRGLAAAIVSRAQRR